MNRARERGSAMVIATTRNEGGEKRGNGGVVTEEERGKSDGLREREITGGDLWGR